MKNINIPDPLERITFMITHEEKVSLKMMCIFTNKTMSEFIRFAVQEKIKNLKGK